MADIVDPQTRSRMMSGIRGRNTKPELLVRKGLFKLGFRYRLHAAGLPGKPDIVLKKYNAAVFVNGCFWHGHGCHLCKMPATRPEFWQLKIAGNVRRDGEVYRLMRDRGWRLLVVWECALRSSGRLDFGELMVRVSDWLRGEESDGEIAGVR